MKTPVEQAREIREMIEAKYGAAWNTAEFQRDYTVESFEAPFVIVIRKSDGIEGSLQFTRTPRFYFDFCPSIDEIED